MSPLQPLEPPHPKRESTLGSMNMPAPPQAAGSGNIGNAMAGMALQQPGVVFKVMLRDDIVRFRLLQVGPGTYCSPRHSTHIGRHQTHLNPRFIN